jgi:hypothetical protein
MRIGNQEFGRVAVLVLDYRPEEKHPAKILLEANEMLGIMLRARFGNSSKRVLDSIVLANETLVAKHEADFRERGAIFFENWQESREYRDLLREGVKQGDIYVVMDVGIEVGTWGKRNSTYLPIAVKEDEVTIIDRDGKIDIRPMRPLHLLG